MPNIKILRNSAPLTIILLFALSVTACSISDSVSSISRSSESISDSSKSSSKSSESEPEKATANNYEQEIVDFTVTYMRTNATVSTESFKEGISDIASQNGIVDWESNPKTYRAIGKGLLKAKITGSRYEMYRRNLSDGDRGKMDDIQEGYTGGD